MAIKLSPCLALLLSLSHAVVAVVVYASAMPPAARLAILAPILSSLFYYLARDVLLFFPGSWREISLGQDRLSVVTRNGSSFYGQVEGKTAISPYFIVLHIRPEGRRLPVFRVIFPDALDKGAFRELCVRLRYSGKPV